MNSQSKTTDPPKDDVEDLQEEFKKNLTLSEESNQDAQQDGKSDGTKDPAEDLTKRLDPFALTQELSNLSNEQAQAQAQVEIEVEVETFPLIEIVSEICRVYCGQKPTKYKDLKSKKDFKELIQAWALDFGVNFDHFKKKLEGRELSQTFPLEKFWEDMEIFFKKERTFEREDHISVILCLHALFISDCDVKREVRVKRTYYDKPAPKGLSNSSSERADIMIFGAQKKPLFLLELKVLSPDDFKEDSSECELEFRELFKDKDDNSLAVCTRRVLGLQKDGISTTKQYLAYAVEQARSCYRLIDSQEKKSQTKFSSPEKEESPISLADIQSFMKVPRYGILVGPKMFEYQGHFGGYFPIEKGIPQDSSYEISLNAKVVHNQQEVFSIRKRNGELSGEDSQKIKDLLEKQSYFEMKEEEKKEEGRKKISRKNTPIKENEEDPVTKLIIDKKIFSEQHFWTNLRGKILAFDYSEQLKQIKIELKAAIDILRVKNLLLHEYIIE